MPLTDNEEVILLFVKKFSGQIIFLVIKDGWVGFSIYFTVGNRNASN